MAMNIEPIIGTWYQRADKGQEFEVVAFDDEDGVVEIQDSDGNLEEIDIDTWYTLELENIEAPVDYTGDTMDDDELDDPEYDDSDVDDEDWDEV